MDTNRWGLRPLQLLTSCPVEEERLPTGILDHHDGAIVVLQVAGDVGRASLKDCHTLCLHRLTTG